MGKFDIDEAVRVIKQVMIMTGTWPQLAPTFAYRMTGFVTMFASIAITVTTLMKVIIDFADLQSASFGICCSLIAFNNLAKHYTLFFNKSQFYKILNSLKEPILATHEDHLDVFLQDKVHLARLCSAMMFFMCFSTTFMGMLFPILNTETERPLPIPFPMDMKNQHWLIYYLVYGFQSISLELLGFSISCLDGIIFTFIAIAAGQLRIVREKIIRATNSDPSATSSLRLRKPSDTVVNDILIQCVKHHIAVDRYIMLIQDTFRIGFLIQLVVSLIVTCVLGFNFILLSITSLEFLMCIFFFGGVLVDLAFFCIPGNEIILQSEKIRDACYMSEWMDYGTSVRKSLFIIMERSKRPLTLTAANFVELSLNTLVGVLNKSFSYFIVLTQLYRNSNKI